MYEDERNRFLRSIERVDTLIIGESRPFNGTFFYFRNSNLYTYVNEVVAIHANVNPRQFDCIDFFKSKNIFLDDLNREPVNHLPRDIRRKSNRNAVSNLSDRIKEYRPRIVITILKGIRKEVDKAILLSGHCPEKVYYVSFPANGQQNNFRNEFRTVLNEIFPNNE